MQWHSTNNCRRNGGKVTRQQAPLFYCFRQLSLTGAKMQGKSMMRNRKFVSKCNLTAKNEISLTNKTLPSVSGPVILPWKTVYTHSCLLHFFKLLFQMSKAKMVYFQIWQTPHLPNDQTSPVTGKSKSSTSDMIYNITSIAFWQKKKKKKKKQTLNLITRKY